MRRTAAWSSLIYTLLARVPTRLHRYPEWGTLGLSPAVAALKKAGGATGELANNLTSVLAIV